MSFPDEVVSFSLEINVDKAEARVRKLSTLLFRTMGIVAKLSGSEDLDTLMATMQRAIAIANQMRLALLALQAARMAAGDPLAWALAGVAVAEVGVSLVGDMQLRRPLE